jgi:hypothetical protein
MREMERVMLHETVVGAVFLRRCVTGVAGYLSMRVRVALGTSWDVTLGVCYVLVFVVEISNSMS